MDSCSFVSMEQHHSIRSKSSASSKVLTMQYTDTSKYRRLLLSLVRPLLSERCTTSWGRAVPYVRDLLNWLVSLTPEIVELTSVTVNCSANARLNCLSVDVEENTSHKTMSQLSKRAEKLKTLAISIARRCGTQAAKRLDDANERAENYGGKERVWRTLEKECHSSRERIEETRKKLKQTCDAIQELNGIDRLAVRRRARARSLLILVKVHHRLFRVFGTANRQIVVQMESKFILATKIMRRVRQDREKLVLRSRAGMEELARLTNEDNMRKSDFTSCDAEVRNMERTACFLYRLSHVLEETSDLWLSIARTFDSTSFSCGGECTEKKALEVWHTLSVLMRSFLEDHCETVSTLRLFIQRLMCSS